MSTNELSGQVALVTGGGSGLGAAACRALATHGAHVVVNDVSPSAAELLAKEIDGEPVVFDVSDSSTFDGAVDALVAAHGRIDIVVNNAGIAPPPDDERFQRAVANEELRLAGRLDEMVPLDCIVNLDDASWSRMLRVHLDGTFFGTRAALRHMTPARRGSVINISSVLGLHPAPGAPHYSVAKAGIIALTKSAALDVAPFGVRVNAICPGWVDTPLLAPMNDLMRTVITSRIPMGRLAVDTEIAAMVAFLAGPSSSYCTGEVLSVSGGFA
jgi:3-oxoacyl-[acyl-carrier protein] reductase